MSIEFHSNLITQHTYFNRIIHLWNVLPIIKLSLPISTSYLHQIKEIWSHFENNFDNANPCMQLSYTVTAYTLLYCMVKSSQSTDTILNYVWLPVVISSLTVNINIACFIVYIYLLSCIPML